MQSSIGNGNGVQRWVSIAALGFTLFVAAIAVSSQLSRSTDTGEQLRKATDALTANVDHLKESLSTLDSNVAVLQNIQAYNNSDIKQLKSDVNLIRDAVSNVVESQRELTYELKLLSGQEDGRREGKGK